MSNFFAFNSTEEMIEMREFLGTEDTWAYKTDKNKPGTLISPKMEKHWFNNCKKNIYYKGIEK